MIQFKGKIVKENGFPMIDFDPKEYSVEEIREILFGMYNYLVSVDFMQIFSTDKLPRTKYKNKKLK